ncbi:hypothetical protein V6N13_081238 [Hibiscus sabdariffa]
MQWLFKNGKLFILSDGEHARVIPAPRLERPRHQYSSRSTNAFRGSRRRTSAASSSDGATPPSEGSSTEHVTLIPLVFLHTSNSTFHGASSLFATGPSDSSGRAGDDNENDDENTDGHRWH